MIVCAGRNEIFDFATPIGVGLIESAINLTRLCLTQKPEKLIFVGSAGSYGDYKIFDILESKKASNIELSFLEQNSYTPLESIIESKDNDYTKSDIIVNSSNYISINFKVCQKYKEHGISIENMEFFSILQVANEFEIPVYGIFVITNYTNENAHKDFIINHKEAMKKLIKYIERKQVIQNVSRETFKT